MKLRYTNTGFTLIELLVVIAIIGILASVVLASLSTAQRNARDTSRVAEIKQLKTALELYYNDNNRYVASCSGTWAARLAPLVPTYMSTLPSETAPHTQFDYCGGVNVNGNGPGYGIRIRFEDTNRPNTTTTGFCKTGVNMNPTWWGSAPTCSGLGD